MGLESRRLDVWSDERLTHRIASVGSAGLINAN
jgi:hypothetical protein